MSRLAALALLAAGAATAGCTATRYPAQPIDVTRFHLSQPLAPGAVAVSPVASTDTISPEYRAYADAVAAELARLGFRPAPGPESAQYVAGLAFRRANAGTISEPPPFTIGFGGASFGRNVGVGGGASVGIGGKTRTVIRSELWVQLRRRSDDTVVWEGRAVTESVEGSAAAIPEARATRLARALFKGFPGESGITITVK